VVQEMIAPERLLVFDIKEGWEPLCAFLDVPVPEDDPFPRVNDRAAFQGKELGELRAQAKRALDT
jgi:hypothetical protein